MQDGHRLDNSVDSRLTSAPEVSLLLSNATHHVQGRVIVDINGRHVLRHVLLDQVLVVLPHQLLEAQGGVQQDTGRSNILHVALRWPCKTQLCDGRD